MRMEMSSHSIVSLSVIALFGLAVGSHADAQGLSRNPNPPTVSTGPVKPTLPLNAVSITHPASLVVELFTPSGVAADWRHFDTH